MKKLFLGFSILASMSSFAGQLGENNMAIDVTACNNVRMDGGPFILLSKD